MDNTKELTHISLCAGYGGIDIGLKRAVGAIRTVAFSEIEAYAVANLVAKIEKGLLDKAPIWSDLKTFPWQDFYKKVDVLSGGFPCQPFSTAGRRGGDEDPRHLFPYIIKGIKQLGRPPIVFFENVEGIISSKIKAEGWSDPIGTPVLLHVLRELEKVGYKTTAGVFSAVEVGATHQRKRVFILGLYGSPSINLAEKTNELTTRYPLPRTSYQYLWEAPRTISTLEYTNGNNLQKCFDVTKCNIKKIKGRSTGLRQYAGFKASQRIKKMLKSSMGGAAHGASCGLDSSHLFISFDNITDELRLLGNGVVPDTATKAFITLFKKLANSNK